MRISEFTSAIHTVIRDRSFMGFAIGLLVISVAYCVYVGFSLQTSDVQVAVRYTGFGSTNYYRDHWYYLLSFVLFGVMVAIVNTAIAGKLFVLERPSLARAWLIGSISLVVVAAIITHSVFGAAYL